MLSEFGEHSGDSKPFGIILQLEARVALRLAGTGVSCELSNGSISQSWRNFLPGKHLSSARKRTVVLVTPGGTGVAGYGLRLISAATVVLRTLLVALL